MSTTQKLAQAVEPFVITNSSEEYVILIVRSSDITKARQALAAHEADKQAGRDSAQAVVAGSLDALIRVVEEIAGANSAQVAPVYSELAGNALADYRAALSAAPKGD
jgi:hypothetical protein